MHTVEGVASPPNIRLWTNSSHLGLVFIHLCERPTAPKGICTLLLVHSGYQGSVRCVSEYMSEFRGEVRSKGCDRCLAIF